MKLRTSRKNSYAAGLVVAMVMLATCPAKSVQAQGSSAAPAPGGGAHLEEVKLIERVLNDEGKLDYVMQFYHPVKGETVFSFVREDNGVRFDPVGCQLTFQHHITFQQTPTNPPQLQDNAVSFNFRDIADMTLGPLSQVNRQTYKGEFGAYPDYLTVRLRSVSQSDYQFLFHTSHEASSVYNAMLATAQYCGATIPADAINELKAQIKEPSQASVMLGGTAQVPTQQTDFQTISGKHVLTFLNNAEKIQIDPKGLTLADPENTVEHYTKQTMKEQRKATLNAVSACNGKNADIFKPGEQACQRAYPRGDLESGTVLYKMTVLLRSCGVYARIEDKANGGFTCGALGQLLYDIGNVEAAKTVWEQASGCFSYHAHTGLPVNGCASDVYNAIPAFKSEPLRAVRIAWKSCGRVYDDMSCQLLTRYGVKTDMSLVAQAAQQEHEAMLAYKEDMAEKNAKDEERQAEKDARFNALMSTMQSMGASNPNLITETGNRQADAMRAVGNANAAAQQQAAQARVAAQQTAAQQAQTGISQKQQQGAAMSGNSSASSANSSQTLAGGGSANSGGASGGNGGTASNSGSPRYASPISSSCIRQFWDPQVYNWLSFENNCGVAINLNFIFNAPAGWAMNGSMTLAPGAHKNSGLSGSDINKAGGFKYYVCPDGYIPVDANDQVISTAVAEFRCKSL